MREACISCQTQCRPSATTLDTRWAWQATHRGLPECCCCRALIEVCRNQFRFRNDATRPQTSRRRLRRRKDSTTHRIGNRFVFEMAANLPVRSHCCSHGSLQVADGAWSCRDSRQQPLVARTYVCRTWHVRFRNTWRVASALPQHGSLSLFWLSASSPKCSFSAAGDKISRLDAWNRVSHSLHVNSGRLGCGSWRFMR